MTPWIRSILLALVAAAPATAQEPAAERPNLRTAGSTLGAPLALRIENGGAGPYVLGAAPRLLIAPLRVGVHHGLALDPATLSILGTGRLDAAGAAELSLSVPHDPALAGLTLHFQGLTPGGFTPVTALTFTLSPGGPGTGQPASFDGFRLMACSLACAPVPGQITQCATNNVAVNEIFRFTFNEPLGLASVNNSSFQVFNSSTGAAPAASFFVDPNDARSLIYLPQISVDSGGNLIFGLDAGETYSMRVPGIDHDPIGPWVSSAAGDPNRDRFQCVFVAGAGVADFVPGAPTALVTVDLVTPTGFAFDQPAAGATNVWVDTDITFTFFDVMLPSTLIDPITGLSSSLVVELDPDGDVTTTADRIPVGGTFTLDIDILAKETRVVFDPFVPLPNSGGPPTPSLVVVSLAATITDAVGNALANAGSISFENEP